MPSLVMMAPSGVMNIRSRQNTALGLSSSVPPHSIPLPRAPCRSVPQRRAVCASAPHLQVRLQSGIPQRQSVLPPYLAVSAELLSAYPPQTKRPSLPILIHILFKSGFLGKPSFSRNRVDVQLLFSSFISIASKLLLCHYKEQKPCQKRKTAFSAVLYIAYFRSQKFLLLCHKNLSFYSKLYLLIL